VNEGGMGEEEHPGYAREVPGPRVRSNTQYMLKVIDLKGGISFDE